MKRFLSMVALVAAMCLVGAASAQAVVPFAQSGNAAGCTMIAYTPWNAHVLPGPTYYWGGRMYCAQRTYVADLSACPQVVGSDGVTWYSAGTCSHTGPFILNAWVEKDVFYYSRGTSGHTYRSELGVNLWATWFTYWSTRYTL